MKDIASAFVEGYRKVPLTRAAFHIHIKQFKKVNLESRLRRPEKSIFTA